MPQVEPLPFAYNALEPFIDEQTMRIHHDKHYQTYLDKYTTAIEKFLELKAKKVEEVLSDLKNIPTEIKTAVVNHGGGYANHKFFWQVLKKGTECKGEILAELNRTFGSYDQFKEEFSKSALGLFGSGWTWLVWNSKDKKVEIMNTSNQDSPLSIGKIPLLTLDVWEHAYYLKYQNRRAEYVENFFQVINWDNVNGLFLKVK